MLLARNLSSSDPNELIEATEYDKNTNHSLVCPCCAAPMVHVKASEESSVFFRIAHFRTKAGKNHDDGCAAYLHDQDFKKSIKSL